MKSYIYDLLYFQMNLFITSALQKNDMRAVSLQLAMDLLHKNVTVEYGKMIRLFLVVLGKREIL